MRSSDNIAKSFYLQLDNGKIDTVFLDIVRLSEPLQREYNKYKQVKFNEQTISLDKIINQHYGYLKDDEKLLTTLHC